MNLTKFLFEQDEDSKDAPEGKVQSSGDAKARKSADSVDDQIDSLILLYEKRAIRDEEDALMEALFKGSLRMLLEQEEEAAEDPVEEPVEDDTGVTEPTGSEEMTADAAEGEKVPDLDIDKFTIKVARLIMNYRKLLDVETAIVNRVKNFLDENYGDRFVSAYLDILEEQFGITIEEFDVDYAEDVPLAVGANPAGAGSVGG